MHRLLAELDVADLPLEQVVSDITSEFEHTFRKHVPPEHFAASGSEAQDEVDRLVARSAGWSASRSRIGR